MTTHNPGEGVPLPDADLDKMLARARMEKVKVEGELAAVTDEIKKLEDKQAGASPNDTNMGMQAGDFSTYFNLDEKKTALEKRLHALKQMEFDALKLKE